MDVSGSGSLAEWSQKIKNLQAQVDEDGLQEQARLEAEIARSRMERARRRSTLTGNARVDQASASYLSRLPDDVNSPPDKQLAQADALQRLTGSTTARVTTPPSPSPAPNSSNSSLSKPASLAQPVSLAAFMGGRATGPRLNKQAPQADYEDHARDYEARRGGGATPLLQKIAQPSPVALHGLAKNAPPKKEFLAQAEKRSEGSMSPAGSFRLDRPEVKKEDPQAVKAVVEPLQQPARTSPLPIKPIRDISTSSSSTTSSSRSTGQTSFVASPLGISVPTTKASTGPPGISQPSSSSTPITARWTNAISPSPLKSPPLSSPSPSTPPQITRLARPVQPTASPVQHFVPPTNPSPAFLKPQAPKEERPSITRLQGRGFVERQIQVSARLTSTPEEAPKFQRPNSSDRKLTVLQRWPGEGAKSPTGTPEKAVPTKREFTRSLPPTAVRPSEVAASSSPANFNKPVQTRTRNLEHDSTPLRLPGMNGAGSFPGKSTSLPQSRTGERDDSPAVVASTPMPLPGLAAEGTTPSALRKSSSSSQLKQPSKRRSVHFEDNDEAVASGVDAFDGNQTDVTNAKKLTHLTKDRARKPRKPASQTMVAHTPVESTPTQEKASAIPAPKEEKREEPVIAPVLPVQKPKPQAPIKPQLFVSSKPQEASKPLPVADIEPPSPSPAIPITPTTPASARPPSREKNRLPPPIVAPKPAALRRNSLPSPAESPMTPKQFVVTPSTNGSQRADIEAPSKVAGTPPPSLRDETEAEDSPRVSVKAAISAWGQQSKETKKADRDQPSSSYNSTASRKAEEPPLDSGRDHSPTQLKQALNAAETPTESPAIVVPTILNPPTIPMPQPRPRPVSQSSSERRRSITNRYSSIILPPLKEEKTPAATPEGSLRIAANTMNKEVPTAQALHKSLVAVAAPPSQEEVEPTKQQEEPARDTLTVETEVPKTNGHSPISPLDRIVSIPHDDPPLPNFSLSRLLASIPSTPKAPPGSVISVETFVISGSSSTAVKNDPHIFYEGEIIAIVYRGKNKTTGLVTTTVWTWVGSKATLGNKEESKLQDMASRFNTSQIKVPQGKEPFDLIQMMGGTIAIRHGSRSHWTPENTALHCVRTHGSHFIVIEEVELMSRNICSAFTYCLAILDGLFVWYGRGTTRAERDAALTYAKAIAAEGATLAELEEGVEDEMFWMMLDEGEYANADFWKFRAQSPIIAPRLWTITDAALQPVIPFCSHDLVSDKIFMYDGIFELFVIVGEDARSKREDIRLALAAAESVAAASALTREFPPPLHVLVFPTRIPVDLRANFRLMDYHEAKKPSPEHINLLTLGEAQSQLQQQEWKLRDLKDPNFLPLAISPSMHPDLTQ